MSTRCPSSQDQKLLKPCKDNTVSEAREQSFLLDLCCEVKDYADSIMNQDNQYIEACFVLMVVVIVVEVLISGVGLT